MPLKKTEAQLAVSRRVAKYLGRKEIKTEFSDEDLARIKETQEYLLKEQQRLRKERAEREKQNK